MLQVNESGEETVVLKYVFIIFWTFELAFLIRGSASAAMARKDYAEEKGKRWTLITTAWQQQVGSNG